MKAFIVAALLVASAAAIPTLDILKLNKEKSMLKFDRPLVNELLLKKLGHPLEKSLIYGENIDIPLYLQDELLDKKVLQLEELTMTPIFREYMSLPIFRQFWSYPMFQRFVSSVYFQRFMHIPAFKQYFINPVLFYKYVYPLVTLFKTTDVYTDDITTHSVLDEIVKGDLFKGDLINKNVFPFVSDYEQDLVKDKFTFPTIYNKEFQTYDDIYSKTLLEKLYKDLLINKPIVDDEFLGKIVDPITGNIKTVDDEVIPVEYIKTIYGEKLVRDVLIKKLIQINVITPEIFEYLKLGKIDLVSVLLKKDIITPDVYQLILLGKVDKFTVYRHILRQNVLKTVVVEDLLKEVLLKKLVKFNVITPEVYEAILLKKIDLLTVLVKKNIITPEIYQLVVLGKVDLFTVLKQVLGDETMTTTVLPKQLVKEVLLKKLIKYNIITPEIYEAILLGKIDFVTVLLKKNLITPEVYQYIMYGKVDKYTVFRTILRQDTLKTVYPQDLLINNFDFTTTNTFDKVNPLFSGMMYNKFDKYPLVNKFDFQGVDNMNMNMNLFDIKKDIMMNDETLPFYMKKDLFNDKLVLNKVFADKVNEIDNFKLDTVVPKMVDIQTPMMGVRTFDKKVMIPEVIKA